MPATDRFPSEYGDVPGQVAQTLAATHVPPEHPLLVSRLSLDELASRLPIAYWEVRVHSATKLASEMVTDTAEFNPQVILIGSLPPGGVAHARYLVKRLRQRFPDAQIVMGRWNDSGLNVEEWKAAGCDTATASLRDALKHLNSWKPVLQAEEAVKA